MRRKLALSLLLLGPGILTAATAARAAVAKGPWVQRITPSSAVVRVEVDPPAPASFELGAFSSATDGGPKKTILQSAEKRSVHSFVVDQLTPATRYTYAVRVGGESKYAAFTTAPREDSRDPFRFLIYGDNRTDDVTHAAIVRAMAPVGADFLIHTGDFVENGASSEQWKTFFQIEAPLLKERCIFSCVGNHELTDGRGLPYLKYFGPRDFDPARADAAPPSLDELDGTFRWSNTRFFLLNGMVPYHAGASREWLENALENADVEPGVVWRIVVVHHGPWSSGPHGNNPLFAQAGVANIFRRHKVDLVISGHDHIYERGFANDMAYLVSGGGGAPVYKVKSRLPSTLKAESVHHFVEASVSEAAIRFTTTRVDGSTLERCALRKSGGWDCDDPPSATPAAAFASATPLASSQAQPQAPSPPPSRCACNVVGAHDDPYRGVFLTALFCTGFVGLSARRKRREILGACASRPSRRC